MKITWRIRIPGAVEGKHDGVFPGDIMDVSDDAGARYCALRYSTPVVDRQEEHAVAPEGEKRVSHFPDKDWVDAIDEPEPRAKRGPGRPPKVS